MSNFRQEAAGEGAIAVRSLALGLPPGFGTGLHQHDWPQLVHATQGALTVRASGQVWVVPAHRALWVPAGVAHEVEAAGRVRMRTLYVRPDLAAGLAGELGVLAVSELLRALIHEICSGGMLRMDVPPEARLVGVVLDQLTAARDVSLTLREPRDPRALCVARRVLAEPGAKSSLAELADGCGASPRTIERLFLDEAQLSFGRWRREARLMHALCRLSEGASVTEAGLDAGYSSTSAFVSVFRAWSGVTPGAYREAVGSRD